MRAYANLPRGGIDVPMPPDSVQTFLLAAATGQNLDWPYYSSTGGTTAARNVGAQIVRFTGFTTAGALLNFMVNLASTKVNTPSSGSSVDTGTTAGSVGNALPVVGTRMFQIPAWSTGYSVIAQSSGYVMAEVWQH